MSTLIMTASEHLQHEGIEECPECHYSTKQSDWEYKDFTCKTVAICPQCKEVGLKSTVYPGITTAMYCQPFYDEDGNFHDHGDNTATSEYSCSNGHKWTESPKGKCWCGWDGN